MPHTVEHMRPRTARSVVNEENILNSVDANPEVSVRELAVQTNIAKSSAFRILKEQVLHPYHMQRVQYLLPRDGNSRVQFCMWLREQILRDNGFSERILMTDEACFSRNGFTNIRNYHQWADENPHATRVIANQHLFSINVWAGIIGKNLLGPVELPQRLNGQQYMDFLMTELPNLLDEVPIGNRINMWFMHDGAPPHFALGVREFLNDRYPGRWIGCGLNAPVQWPPRSPDLNPLDFFFWSHLKGLVYRTPVHSREELWNRILAEAHSITQNPDFLNATNASFRRRIDLCIEANNAHFENLF